MVCIRLCCDHNVTVSGGGGSGDWRRMEEAHLDAGDQPPPPPLSQSPPS